MYGAYPNLSCVHGTFERKGSNQGPMSSTVWKLREENGFAGRLTWLPLGTTPSRQAWPVD